MTTLFAVLLIAVLLVSLVNSVTMLVIAIIWLKRGKNGAGKDELVEAILKKLNITLTKE